jgi:hypothetical protein
MTHFALRVTALAEEKLGLGVSTAPAISKKCSDAITAPIGNATANCIQAGRGVVQSQSDVAVGAPCATPKHRASPRLASFNRESHG